MRKVENGIKAARLAAGLTQAEMAEKYGIPLGTLKAWDSGRAYPQEWVERLLLDKMQSDRYASLKGKLESMYGNSDKRGKYDVMSGNGVFCNSVSIIGDSRCRDEIGFFQYALMDDCELYKAYYRVPESGDYNAVDFSKPLIMIPVDSSCIQ